MKLRITLFAITLTAGLFVLAQEKEKSFQIKAFSGINHFDVDEGSIEVRKNMNSHSILSSASVSIVKGDRFIEFELDRFKIQHNENEAIPNSSGSLDGGDVKTREFRIRLSYNYLKSISSKINVAIGMGVSPYLLKENISPSNPLSFDRRHSSVGASLDLIPRFQFNMTKKVFFETHLVLSTVRLNRYETQIENPAIPLREQTETDSSVRYFGGDYQVRFGIGLTL